MVLIDIINIHIFATSFMYSRSFHANKCHNILLRSFNLFKIGQGETGKRGRRNKTKAENREMTVEVV